MDNSKLWKYCVLYLGIAIVFSFVDIVALPGMLLAQVDRYLGGGVQIMAKAPVWLYLIGSLVVDRGLGWYTRHCLNQNLEEQGCPPPMFRVIACARGAALAIWALALVVQVEHFWIGLFHMPALIDAMLIALQVMAVCKGEWHSK